ncbi:phage portal protein [Falsihalocynthiibacter sp. S25ZX9]|uniref:phage portal protein n=1 Tax=Falsihalocynthiibacter sp. S25ZX9 TaxID=3240870 RepID=UPI0035100F12
MFDFLKRQPVSQSVRSEPSVQSEPSATFVEAATSIPAVSRRQFRQRSFRGTRQHDAANTDRMTSNWTRTPLSADQVVDRNQRILVARSREQSDSNDYLKSYLRICEQNVVGPRGFSLQAQARDAAGNLDRDANEAIETWWRNWCRAENCDIKGRRSFRLLCKSAIRTAAKDGEFMFREIIGRAAGPSGYSLQTIDPQRCPVDYNIERLSGGRFIRQGIEFSREGRALAFFFMTDDPSMSGYTFNGRSVERVPAAQIIHGFLDEMEGQRRGLPWAATSLWRLHMLAGFEKASLSKATTSAALGGFIEWADGSGPEPDEENEDEELYIEAEGGVYQELPPGASAKNFETQYPSGEFATFHKAMLRGAGAGMGVSYVALANDLEGVNFSSIRQGVLSERDNWMDLQEWTIETLVDRVFSGALKAALLRGQVKVKARALRPENIGQYLKVFWQGRRWAWVDPTKDVKAEVDAKNNLLTSPSEIIRRRGDDPDTTWRTYASDIKLMQDAGMPEAFIMASVLGVQPSAAPPPKLNDEEDSPDE